MNALSCSFHKWTNMNWNSHIWIAMESGRCHWADTTAFWCLATMHQDDDCPLEATAMGWFIFDDWLPPRLQWAIPTTGSPYQFSYVGKLLWCTVSVQLHHSAITISLAVHISFTVVLSNWGKPKWAPCRLAGLHWRKIRVYVWLFAATYHKV